LNKGSERTSSLCDHALQHAPAVLSLSSLPWAESSYHRESRHAELTVAQCRPLHPLKYRRAVGYSCSRCKGPLESFIADRRVSGSIPQLSKVPAPLKPNSTRHTEFSSCDDDSAEIRNLTRAMCVALLKLPLLVGVHADTRPSHARMLR